MPLMKITGPGLCSMAIATGILWGCIFVERSTVAHARAEAYRALDEIRILQRKEHIVPAASPVLRPRQARAAVG
jgi:hypothetical protein